MARRWSHTKLATEFCNRIIEPYEKMFPREKKQEEEELPVDFEQKEISK
jgi:hypothetical protein